MGSLSFDNVNVEFYDETRVFDRVCFNSALDFLVGRFPPKTFGEILEPGVGTGRIAIPLAERGYHVTGIDISEEMLGLLRKRLATLDRPLDISLQRADVTGLPFPDAKFDMAVVVHLFYFIQKWREAADEILRVVRSCGPVVLMHTGMGAEIPFLNERYKELCAGYGFPIRSVGVRSTGEVVDYLVSLGCHAEWIRDRWVWTSRVRVDKALEYMISRAYSFTTVAPEDTHSKVIERLRSESSRKFGHLAAEVQVQNQIYMVVILREACRE